MVHEKINPSEVDAKITTHKGDASAHHAVHVKTLADHPLSIIPEITPGKLDAIDSPADGEALTYNAATGKFEWKVAVGVTALSDLIIDVNKDWAGKIIKNLGVPVDAGDAYSKGNAIDLADIPTIPYSKLNVANSLLVSDIKSTEFNVANKLLQLDASALVPYAQIPQGIKEETASYTIFIKNSTIYAKNGRTGELEFSGADAKTVIQSALDALTAGRTWKEKVALKGDFSISDSIGIPSNTILDLRGARLRAQNNCSIPAGRGILQNSNFPTVTANHNIEIIGGEIDGNKANNATHFEGIFLGVVDNFLIKDVIVHDCPEVGFAFYPSLTGYLMNGEVRNGISYNNGGDGLQLEMAITNAKGAQIRIIGGRYHDNVNNGLHMRCQTTYAEPPYLELTIEGVEADHNGGQGIGPFWANAAMKKLIVTGCFVHENSQNGIFVQGVINGIVSHCIAEYNGFSGIETWAASNIIISSNITMNNSQTGPGGNNQEAGISLKYGGNIIVANNVCLDDQGTKTQKHGIRLEDVDGCVVEGNRCLDNDLWGIFIGTDSNYNKVSLNYTSGNTSGSIRINAADCDNNQVEFNTVEEGAPSDAGTNTRSYGNYDPSTNAFVGDVGASPW